MDMARDSQVRIETPIEMKRYMNDRLRKSESQSKFPAQPEPMSMAPMDESFATP